MTDSSSFTLISFCAILVDQELVELLIECSVARSRGIMN